jgi:hypothetical protein
MAFSTGSAIIESDDIYVDMRFVSIYKVRYALTITPSAGLLLRSMDIWSSKKEFEACINRVACHGVH